MSEREQRKAHEREMKVKELHQVESRYKTYLDILFELYFVKLRPVDEVTGFISLTNFDFIFRGIEPIRSVTEVIFEELEKVFSDVSIDTPRAKINAIGGIFQRFTPFLKLYVSYVNKFDEVTVTLRTCCKKSPALTDLLSELQCDPISKGQDLTSLLIMPVQKIPRYRLILEDILKLTPVDWPERKPLEEACVLIRKTAEQVNEAIRDHQDREKIRDVHSRLYKCPSLVEPHRKYVREGLLKKVCRKAVKPRYMFLFTDALLYASSPTTSRPGEDKGLLVFHKLLTLKGANVVAVSDDVKCFDILTGAKSFRVVAKDREERDDWVASIAKVINELGGGGVQAAIWQPDDHATDCTVCHKAFTFFSRRRHHCRDCGCVVCATCSLHRIVLLHLSSDPVRVCDNCMAKVDSGEQGAREESSSSELDVPPPRPSPRYVSRSATMRAPAPPRRRVPPPIPPKRALTFRGKPAGLK